jgi:hypothetical protein
MRNLVLFSFQGIVGFRVLKEIFSENDKLQNVLVESIPVFYLTNHSKTLLVGLSNILKTAICYSRSGYSKLELLNKRLKQGR